MSAHPTFREALRFWLKLGLISFGGPAGQIAIMHTELVEKKQWIGEQRFLHALNYCMLLPGPEATQLAIYCGWLLHRTRGGIAAGVLFVLPSALLLWGLSYVYVAYGTLPWIAGIFHGLQPAVTAIVVAAVVRIGRRALQNSVMWGIAVASFVAIYLFKVPFPLIVAGAALVGAWRWKFLAGMFPPRGAERWRPAATRPVIGDADAVRSAHAAPLAGAGRQGAGDFARALVGAGGGRGPLAGLGWHAGAGGILFQQGRAGDLRRRLRGAALRGTAGRGAF